MSPTIVRPCLSVLVSALLLSGACSAMDTPLSEEAVREAYFLGQRHDELTADLLNRYAKFLPTPTTGPNIGSVTFYTPYALAVLDASLHNFNYHAQDAERDHRKEPEIVRVVVQIWLTPTYGAYLMGPTQSGELSPIPIGLRPSDFWKDFRVHVFSKGKRDEEQVFPVDAGGQPIFSCDEGGGCVLSGATIHFDFPVERFAADCASVRVDPPEGATVQVDFDLASLR
jgi:hypothetical protein